MRNLILSLLIATCAHAEALWPVSTAWPFELSLFDGSSMLTGATVTASIGKDTDANGVDDAWWNGSSWTTYNAVSMTEQTGNIHLEGKYAYVFSSTASGSTPNIYHFSSKYTSGATTIYTRETLRTYLPTVATIWGEAMASYTTAGTAGYYLSRLFSGTGSVTITVVSPVATDATITIIKGDSYTGASVLSLSRTWTGIDLTGGTIVANVMTKSQYNSGGGAAVLSAVACTFTGGTNGGTLAVSFPLTSTQTSTLDITQYKYSIVATSATATTHTVFLGSMNVVRTVP